MTLSESTVDSSLLVEVDNPQQEQSESTENVKDIATKKPAGSDGKTASKPLSPVNMNIDPNYATAMKRFQSLGKSRSTTTASTLQKRYCL